VPRHDWQRQVWTAVRSAAAPDESGRAVLVDLGLPRPAELGDGPYVLVGGAARPNLAVAAEFLINGTDQG
jgi:beta-N-acetylhexosaminidase